MVQFKTVDRFIACIHEAIEEETVKGANNVDIACKVYDRLEQNEMLCNQGYFVGYDEGLTLGYLRGIGVTAGFVGFIVLVAAILKGWHPW